MVDRALIDRYLTCVFGAAVDAGMYFSVWTLADQATRFFADVPAAVDYCAERALESDVYCGLGFFRDPPRAGRGAYDDVSGICSLWADVDVENPAAHKKKNLPKTIEEASRLVRDVGLASSFCVESGYGLHAYWLLSEPLIFDGPDHRRAVAGATRRWSLTLRACARARSLDVDMVGDITRVFRVPGTVNYKDRANPRPVLCSIPDIPVRYAPDDFDPFMVAEEYAGDGGRAAVVNVGFVRVDPLASPPQEKFAALSANVPKFARAFTLQRSDLQDQSPSAYDMALADMAAAASWTAQEIADLLIAFRRQNRLEPKNRLDYLQRTIGKAMTAMAGKASLDRLLSDDRVAPADPAQVPPDERSEVISDLSQVLNLSIASVIKDGKTNANYRLRLTDGTLIELGAASDILNQNRFRACVFDATNVAITMFTQPQWLKLVNKIGRAVVIVDNPESGVRDVALDWLRWYLPTQPVSVDGDRAAAMQSGRPFVDGGQLYLNVNGLRRYLRSEFGDRYDRRDVWAHLTVLGFKAQRIVQRDGKNVLTRTYWAAPDTLVHEIFGRSDVDVATLFSQDHGDAAIPI